MTRERIQAGRAEAVVQALVGGDVLALQQLVSPDVVDHSARSGQPAGWAGVRERAMTLCSALPESEIVVDVLSSEGDTVLSRAQVTAVRRDPSTGWAPETTHVNAVFVLRFAEGVLAEMWTSPELMLSYSVAVA